MSSITKPLSQWCVLLVEDDATNSFFLSEMLSLIGVPEPVVAWNGEEAVAAVANGEIDLVFMDCQMPVMDGFEATRRIRAGEENHHLPIIALTAFAFEEDRQACFDAGMDDFLTKPVMEEALRNTLQRWLGEQEFACRPNDFSPSSSEQTNDNSLLDQSSFDELCEMLGKDGTATLITTFLEGLPAKISGMRQASETRQWEDFVRLAHTLKGNCAMLKVAAMSHLCQEMMRLGKTEDPTSVMTLFPTLEEMAQQLTAIMENQLDRITSC